MIPGLGLFGAGLTKAIDRKLEMKELNPLRADYDERLHRLTVDRRKAIGEAVGGVALGLGTFLGIFMICLGADEFRASTPIARLGVTPLLGRGSGGLSLSWKF